MEVLIKKRANWGLGCLQTGPSAWIWKLILMLDNDDDSGMVQDKVWKYCQFVWIVKELWLLPENYEHSLPKEKYMHNSPTEWLSRSVCLFAFCYFVVDFVHIFHRCKMMAFCHFTRRTGYNWLLMVTSKEATILCNELFQHPSNFWDNQQNKVKHTY